MKKGAVVDQDFRAKAGRRISDAGRKEIVALYKTGVGPREISRRTGWSRNTVERTMRRAGIPLRGSKLPHWSAFRRDPEALLELYEECDREMSVLARRLGVTEFALNSFFTRAKLPRRSIQEAAEARGVRMRNGMGQRSHIAGEIANRVRTRCAFPDCSEPHLHIHHLNADRSDNAEENLVALCVNHHLIVEFFIAKALRRGVLVA